MNDRAKRSRRAHLRQRVPLEAPVFCEQCPNLALVLLDESPLCRRCTLAAVDGRQPGWICEHTSPLNLLETSVYVADGAYGGTSDEVA